VEESPVTNQVAMIADVISNRTGIPVCALGAKKNEIGALEPGCPSPCPCDWQDEATIATQATRHALYSPGHATVPAGALLSPGAVTGVGKTELGARTGGGGVSLVWKIT